MNSLNPKTGMTHDELKDFIRNHFEEFMNRKNVDIADVNYAADFVDHGSDVPEGTPSGPAGPKQYMSGSYKRFPDLHVTIEDMITEDDKVVVRNHWVGTEPKTGASIEFRGIIIWRVAARKLVERWAYIGPAHRVQA
jgi:predicted ester cyclase